MLPRPEARLADLSDAWSHQSGQGAPDWTRLRAFLDRLTLHPELAVPAIQDRPPASGSALFDSLLAGIAEKVADDSASPRPAWAEQVPRLIETWESLGHVMRAEWSAATPPQLAARCILIPASSLWRKAR